MKHQIFKNYDFSQEERECAIENIKERLNNGEEPTEEQVIDELYSMSDMDFDDFKWCLNNFLDTRTMVALGTVGTWRGSFNGHKIIKSVRGFYELLKDCDYVHIYDDNGKLMVKGTHHDGSNLFELRTLTSKGERIAYNNEDTYDNMSTNFYSKKTNFWKYMGYC